MHLVPSCLWNDKQATEHGVYRNGRQVNRRMSKSTQHQTLDRMGVAVVLLDPAGQIEFCNNASERLYGWKAHQVAGREVFHALKIHLDADEREEVREALDGGRPWEGKSLIRRADGGSVLAYVDYTPWYGENGGFRGSVLTASHPLDNRKDEEDEAEIRHKLARHSWILEHINEAIFVMDQDNRIEYWNKAAEDLFGWTSQEVRGQDAVELLAAEDGRREAREIVTQVHAGHDWKGDFPFRRKDGSRFIAYTHDTVLPGFMGGNPSYVSVIWDRTREHEEREKEKGIKKEREFQSKALENVGDAIVVTGADSRIVFVNHAAQELYGYEASELVGRDYQQLLEKPMDGQLADETFRLLDSGQTVRSTYDAVRKDGVPLPVQAVTAPLHDADGAVIGTVNIIRDRSEELKRVELEKEAARQEVHVRSLKAREEERARFAQMVAHEVNNPITPIRIQLHILKAALEDDSSPRLRRSVDIIERNINRTTLLLQDMLDVARIHSHRLKLDCQETDLRVVLEQCIEDLRDQANERDVQIMASVDHDLVAQTDPDRLAQVFLNLAGNALKFVPKGGAIRIHAARHEDHIEVRIVDNGTGIAPEDIERVFQPFEQVGDHKKGGSGLGLYISKGIVEAHGGSLWCEPSPPGEGATFVVTLPLDAKPASS